MNVSESVAVEARNVFKVFGRKPQEAVRRLRDGASRKEVASLGTAAVIDASLTVNRGEIFVVMGLSGSGKSTLIRLLNGLLEPTAGEVSVMGTTITGVSAKRLREVRQRHISMVFQHFALLPHRTVLDNIAYGLEVQGTPAAVRRAKAEEVLELVGLSGWGDKLPGELSGGMQQRVGLGRALALYGGPVVRRPAGRPACVARGRRAPGRPRRPRRAALSCATRDGDGAARCGTGCRRAMAEKAVTRRNRHGCRGPSEKPPGPNRRGPLTGCPNAGASSTRTTRGHRRDDETRFPAPLRVSP